MTTPTRAYVGLGSNLGDRERMLERALELLSQRGFTTTARSSLYWTEPVGGPPQEWFLNAVAAGETHLGCDGLLDACLATERDLGRVRGERYGPRTLDADILLYGGEVQRSERLTLPHPRLHERRFVLVPLAELAPDVCHPRLGHTVAELLRQCPDSSRVLGYPPPDKARV